MLRSLTFKLTLAFLIVSLTGITLVAVLVWGITADAFNRFLIDRGLDEYIAAATNYYEANGSWDGVSAALAQQGLHPSPGQGDNGRGQSQLPFVLIDANRQLIVPYGRMHAGERMMMARDMQDIAITVDGQVVGYVQTTGRSPIPNLVEQRYLVRTNRALILAALGAGLTAVLLGLLLAQGITRPVRELTLAASALANGQSNQPVPVRSNDELGELTATFNHMSAGMEQANRLRKQMTADIAHDLRSPLAVLTGYLEGLKDGVLKPTPERYAAMYDEAIFLQRLVEDLRTLSLADAGELSMNYQVTRPEDLIERLAASFQHQAEQVHVDLKTELEPSVPTIKIDPERMVQVMSNLIHNALRHTPSSGEITLAARQENGQVLLEVRDTGSGISPELLPHIFERFYRGDDSRHEGGSGLGLAIAKSIVEIQGGTIRASSAGPGQGCQFTIYLSANSTR